ncbi:hypothetical protein FB451DRAFT_1446713 [Mycena latifolia]|nr:hypothetical protein FB451DRAFT_1446713 [Mycena latifolia]
MKSLIAASVLVRSRSASNHMDTGQEGTEYRRPSHTANGSMRIVHSRAPQPPRPLLVHHHTSHSAPSGAAAGGRPAAPGVPRIPVHESVAGGLQRTHKCHTESYMRARAICGNDVGVCQGKGTALVATLATATAEGRGGEGRGASGSPSAPRKKVADRWAPRRTGGAGIREAAKRPQEVNHSAKEMEKWGHG